MPRKILGIDSNVPVAPGAIVTVFVRPQLPFKIDRIHVPLHIASYFDIYEIRIGHCSEFIAATKISADTFSLKFKDEDIEPGEKFECRTALVGMDIMLEVTNKSIKHCRFQASLIGEEIREEPMIISEKDLETGVIRTHRIKDVKRVKVPYPKETRDCEDNYEKAFPEKAKKLFDKITRDLTLPRISTPSKNSKKKSVINCQGDEDGDI